MLLIGNIQISLLSFCQIKEDLDFVIKVNDLKVSKRKAGDILFSMELSESKLAFKGFIVLYQQLISSQDTSECIFTLSCSNFAISAVNKFGIFHGLLMSSDRLQRCNGLGIKYYPINAKKGLAIDYPIENYYLFRKKKVLE